MNQIQLPAGETGGRGPFSGLKLFLIITGATVCALLISFGVVRYFLFSSAFVPTSLNKVEHERLANKLQQLRDSETNSGPRQGTRLKPEPYSEKGESREIEFSQRELNGLIARDPELAQRFAIDLSDNLVSGRLLVPLDRHVPLLGGKTLEVKAGLALSFRNGRPVVKLKGISLWGIPMPNAWLGNLKNVDLIEEFGDQGGFWSAFAAGVDEIRVKNGKLFLRLKE